MATEKRLATAVGQSKQGAWTRWESVEQRCMTWNVLWQMEPLRISFPYRSTYDLSPTPANLSVRYEDKTDYCSACGKKGTLQYVLRACPTALSGGMYTWRHNNVLKVIVEAVQQQVEHNNATQPPGTTKHFISFVEAGSQSRSYSSKPRSSKLSSAVGWQVRFDLDGKGGFPEEISVTALRPDIIIWSETGKEVILWELTVPWEDNIDETHERKQTKYTEMAAECRDRGWKALCYPFEVGCRGFIANSFQNWYEILASTEEGSSLLVE